MLERAGDFLVRRPKELPDVFNARVERFSYHDHVGGAVDWYLAAMFEKPADVRLAEGKKLAAAQEPFYEGFAEDCDRAGTSFEELFRDVLKDILVFGASYVLQDLPPKGEYANAAEEQQAGALNPYLCTFDPRQAINYQLDRYGALDWIVFATRTVRGASPLTGQQVVDSWYIYERKTFAVYERIVPADENTTPDDAEAVLVRSGEHAMADRNVCPVVKVDVPEGMWLLNRAYLPAIDHLNTDNVLGWALTMAALAMPVIMTDATIEPSLSEAGFIKLPKDSSYTWTEPAGTSFEHLAERARSLVEDIYRAFYLVAQARTQEATPTAQSGLSKQMDMMPSKKVMNLFGDLLRAVMVQVLNRVSHIRGDELEWDVRGFEFPETPADSEIKTASDAMALGIPSITVEKELYKKVVAALFADAAPEVLAKMFEEIDAAPSKEDREAEALRKQTVVTAAGMIGGEV